VAGSDTRGTITLTTGTTGTGAGNLAVLAFNTGYPAAPVVVLTPANADAAGLQTYVSAELSQLTVNGRTPPAPSTQYQWTYHVIG
jgi:cobalamin biosynthesis protein CbiD